MLILDGPTTLDSHELPTSNQVFIDPAVAIGYRFDCLGPNLVEVLVRAALPGGDGAFLLDVGGTDFLQLFAGTPFDLRSVALDGLPSFTIRGIDAGEMLDPFDPTAFVTAVRFAQGGKFAVRMTPIVSNVPMTSSALTAWGWARCWRCADDEQAARLAVTPRGNNSAHKRATARRPPLRA